MTQKTPFTHLHTHSHYSLLNALPKIPELVSAAKEDGQTMLAITEDGNMYSAIEFYKACHSNDIKPILGVDLYVAPRKLEDKKHTTDEAVTRLILLAETKQGYLNMIQLVTTANLQGMHNGIPRVDLDVLKDYADGVIAILPAHNSSVSQALDNADTTTATKRAKQYKDIYGDKLYFEITHHEELLGHEEKIIKIKSIAKELSIEMLAAQDAYYLKPEDKVARSLADKIHHAQRLDDEDIEREEDYSFKTTEQMQSIFKDEPELLATTHKVAQMCSNVDLNLGDWRFPDFPKEDGKGYDEMLRDDAFAGLKRRKITETPEILERLEYELGIIKDKGYSPYFLVVSDLMRWAESVDILTNTRGSAAGSFVSYLIDITSINPLTYNLPFERFLNPERPSPPDIDMDIPNNKRDEMINYAREKYGFDAVAQIGTFGTMASRAVVRDVNRALGHPYGMGDKIAKMIPFGAQGFPMTIDRAMELEPELAKAYKEMHEVREVIDYAKELEGNARHVGVHAAGVVISDTGKVTDYMPVQYDPKSTDGQGKLITQYDMHGVEDAGLLKFDFLGLKNLGILADAVKRVKKIQGIDIDVNNLPLEDTKTYEMLAAGHTMGVFQMASTGMTKWLMELKPTDVHDLNAMVALYRPGPMEFIPGYIKGKYDPSSVTYVDPRLEKYLKPTHGILMYQDDIMLIAVELAGYTWLEADMFRKAMGKKIPEIMAQQKKKFHDGCVERGMKESAQIKLWESIETFAAYGFNKAHAVSYGSLAYKTAYMKANYPLEYMSALLTADSGDTEKIFEIVEECKKMNIEVLSPNINESLGVFSVLLDSAGKHTDKIRFGLNSIKNFGEGIAASIVNERKQNGPYSSIANLLERITDNNLNKRSIEALIKCGALDEFAERGRLLANLNTILQYYKEEHTKPEGQDSLFGMAEIKADAEVELLDAPEMPLEEKLRYEKELLGLYLSGHPLDAHKDKLSGKKDIATTKSEVRKGITTVVAGLVEDVHTIITKKGDKMAFIRLSDYQDTLEIVVFPKVYADYHERLVADTCILVKGKISVREGEKSFMADAVKPL
jgi:DNA polymerase-3 subunit alpha